MALAVILGIIAVGVFLPDKLARLTIALAVALGLAIWVLGENFGALFTGSGTDPNSGPLLMLLAAAYWPYALGSGRHVGRNLEATGA